MIKIAPSILSADFANLERDIKLAESGGADLIHIDVMDGHFVPNITIGVPVVSSLRKVTTIPFDVHLMIEKPENYVMEFAKSGADIITIHAESTYHIHRVLQMIKKEGIKSGIALNPATPVSILENIIYDVDMVLIMSVNPGFGGQKFIDSCYDKIKAVRSLINDRGLNIDIEVDGGINVYNIAKVAECGANIFVAGSAIYNSGSISEAIAKMKNSCQGAII